MIASPFCGNVYLAVGSTDMRKAINGLSIMVEQAMDLDPFSGDLFVFCNRKRTIIKILYWDHNGFCLWHKRLEKHRFKWPEKHQQSIHVGVLRWSAGQTIGIVPVSANPQRQGGADLFGGLSRLYPK